jgi:hypothetical protein
MHRQTKTSTQAGWRKAGPGQSENGRVRGAGHRPTRLAGATAVAPSGRMPRLEPRAHVFDTKGPHKAQGFEQGGIDYVTNTRMHTNIQKLTAEGDRS